MRFTGTFVTATIDIEKYKAILLKYLEKQIKAAASGWLEGVTSKVPIWSGMSQASLSEVAALTGDKLIIVPVEGVRSRVELGEKLGTVDPHFELNDFKITIITDVPHYNVQEFKNIGVSRSAPWRSVIAGLALAKPIMNSTRLPKPIYKKKTLTLK